VRKPEMQRLTTIGKAKRGLPWPVSPARTRHAAAARATRTPPALTSPRARSISPRNPMPMLLDRTNGLDLSPHSIHCYFPQA
jgi:hypothetical protein